MIVIVVQHGIGFPNGMAATARITGYARGLTAHGHEVLVLCVGTSESGPPQALANIRVRGVEDGVRFEYACGTTVRDSSFLRRQVTRIRGLAVAAYRVRDLGSRGHLEGVLLYSKSPLDAALFRFACHAARAVYLAELCELPFPGLGGGVLGKLGRGAYDRSFFSWFDGVIAISRSLGRYADVAGRKRLAVLQAPVIVNTDEFGRRPGGADSPPVITYCGYLNQEKDGVLTLMRAFRDVRTAVPGVRLRLIGDWWKGTRVPEFRTEAERLGIARSVEFLGTVPRAEIPHLLARASVLVLARPISPQADAGMPTKVAEYLASGVPTVLTRTGDLGDLLEDRVNTYLVPPGDVGALASAIVDALTHRAEAERVGLRGREMAVERFDYRVVGALVAEFMARLEARCV